MTRTVLGVDLSDYQVKVDLAAMHKDGVAVFILKATQGTGYTATTFAKRWPVLAAMGVRRGAYHFADSNGTPEQQAAHFLAVTKPRPRDQLVLDIEEAVGMAPAEFVRRFRLYIHRHTISPLRPFGKHTTLYSYESFFQANLKRYLTRTNARFNWVANYSRPPSIPHRGWQYTSKGRVNGYRGPLDLSRWA